MDSFADSTNPELINLGGNLGPHLSLCRANRMAEKKDWYATKPKPLISHGFSREFQPKQQVYHGFCAEADTSQKILYTSPSHIPLYTYPYPSSIHSTNNPPPRPQLSPNLTQKPEISETRVG